MKPAIALLLTSPVRQIEPDFRHFWASPLDTGAASRVIGGAKLL